VITFISQTSIRICGEILKRKVLLFILLVIGLALSQMGPVIAGNPEKRPGADHASDTAKGIVGDDLIARGANPFTSFGPGFSWLHNYGHPHANNAGRGTAPYDVDGGTLFH
jgi:hypothetical protein